MLVGETSRHHILSPRSAYTTPLECKLRNHRGMVVPGVPNVDHKDMNANLPHPPKPTRDLIAGALVRLSETDLILPLDGLFAVSAYMFERDTKLSNKIGMHLLAQAGYLDGVDYANQQW